LTIIHPLMYSRLPNWLVDHFLKQLPYITQGLSENPLSFPKFTLYWPYIA
jgi:hypothetical protein